MSWTYEIRKERRLVVSAIRDVISMDIVVAHQKHLRADPDFDPTFDQLADLTGVKTVELTTEQIKHLAKSPLFSPLSRRAFVTSSSETFGLARMFQQYREMSAVGEKVRIFRNLDEAYQWLDSR